jgi:hypothetical protein
MADSFEFAWNTPTPSTDEDGNPITVEVPTTIRVGGIPVNIARAIRSGLNREATKNQTINTVTAKRVTESLVDVGGVDP